MKDDNLHLQDILTAIEKIQTYTQAGRDAFFASPMIQDDRQFPGFLNPINRKITS